MNDYNNYNNQYDGQQNNNRQNNAYQNGANNYNYSEYAYSQNQSNPNQNEFSYQPPKKKKSKKILNAALAILCVCAIGTSSFVGYSLLNDKVSTSNSSSSSESTAAVKQASSDSSVSTSERTDFPTIEQLAAPEDAMKIPDIVKKLSPSVVGISCITDGSTVSGTGIIMSEDGYIITNAHVVDGASAISVVMTDSTASTDDTDDDSSSKSVAEKILEKQSDDSSDDDSDNTITAELIGMDTQTDIAVLKIDRTGLTAAEFGTSSDIEVGELAIVIGNPLGFDLANTVTSGIISATDRTLTIEDRTMNLIQTDASINSGNSGGPLINAYGQVIGITSAKVSSTYGEGLGFAIPIDEAKTIINDLVQYGYVKGRPTLGISGENISSFYAQYYNVPEGFIVRSVESGSAAEEAGIQVNDMIVGIQGELISTIEEFNEIKSEYKAGDKITVSVYRNDNIVDLEVTLGEAVDTSSTEDESDDTQQNESDTTDDYDSYDDFRQFYNYYRQNMR
jgi:serine protease Do